MLNQARRVEEDCNSRMEAEERMTMTTITTTTTNTVAAPSKRLQELIASAEAERDLLQPVLTALRDQADAVLGLVQSHKALASSLRTLEQGSQEHIKQNMDSSSPTVLSSSSSLRTASLLSATCDPLRSAATTASATESSLQALSEALTSGVRQIERKVAATAALARHEEGNEGAAIEEIRQFQRQLAGDFDTALFCLEEGTKDAFRLAASALGLNSILENGDNSSSHSHVRFSASSPNSVSSTAATPSFSDGTDHTIISPKRTVSSIHRSEESETSQRAPIHQGWLLKRSSNVRADWKKRRFLLYSDGQIDYHRPLSKSQSARGYFAGVSTTIGGSMHLSITTVKDVPTVSGPPHRFCLVSPNKTIILAAPTEEEKNEWIDMIRKVSASLFETTIPNQSEVSMGSHAASAALAALREAPGNRFCADCSVPNPEWGCLTFGVLVCLECSGGHRRLGTHISKIRSTTLDVRVWTPSTLAMFSDLGNDFVNSIMEEKLRNAEEVERADSCDFHTPPSSPRARDYDRVLSKDPDPDDDDEFDEKYPLHPQSSKPEGKGHLRHKSEDLRMLTKNLAIGTEEREIKPLKPSTGASVKDKEHFVQIKYGNKGFANFPAQELVCSEKIRYDQAMDAAQTNDVQRLLRLMVWFKDEMVSKWSHDLIMAAATGSLSGTDASGEVAKDDNVAALELLTNNDIGLREPKAMEDALIASLKVYRDEAAKLLVRKCPSILQGRDSQGRSPLDIVTERGSCSDINLLEVLSV